MFSTKPELQAFTNLTGSGSLAEVSMLCGALGADMRLLVPGGAALPAVGWDAVGAAPLLLPLLVVPPIVVAALVVAVATMLADAGG